MPVFTKLNNLNCSNNSGLSIIENFSDLSGSLIELYVNDCAFTTLDVQGFTQLSNLNCGGNDFTQIEAESVAQQLYDNDVYGGILVFVLNNPTITSATIFDDLINDKGWSVSLS